MSKLFVFLTILVISFFVFIFVGKLFEQSDVVIISNDNKYFSKLNLAKLTTKMKNNSLIYDVWNLYKKDNLHLKNQVQYFSLGNQRN